MDRTGRLAIRTPARLRAALLVGVCLSAVGVLGCTQSSESAAAGDRPRIVVTLPPEAYLVERIAGERVRVSVLIAPGQSAHTFEAAPRQLAELCTARLYFALDFPFEQQMLGKAAGIAPQLQTISLAAGLARRRLNAAEAEAHEDDGEAADDHSVNAADPHTWLAPALYAQQAQRVRDALVAQLPAAAGEFNAACEQLCGELAALDQELAQRLAPCRGRAFFVFHAAWGYFADAYGLRQAAIENGGKEPSARELVALIDRARAAGARLILIEPQYSRRAADVLAREIHARVETIDPYAKDVPVTLRKLADLILESQTGGQF